MIVGRRCGCPRRRQRSLVWSCRGCQGVPAADQGQCCGGCLLGGGLGRVVAGAEGAVEHEHGVAVRGSNDRGGEPGGRRFVPAGQLGCRGQEDCADGLRGACDLRMAVLAEPGAGQGLEQGPLVVREANVGLGRCSEPLCRGPGCGCAVKLLGEKTGCPERDGGLGAGSPRPSRTPQRRARGVAQQRSGSAPPAGHRGGSGRAWPVRAQPDPRGSLRRGEGHHAAHERVPPAIAQDAPCHRGEAGLGAHFVTGIRAPGGDRLDDHLGHVAGVKHAAGAVAVGAGRSSCPRSP